MESFSLREAKQLRILDFDIENRPLSYLGSDWTTSDITAIAASFAGEKKVHSWFLGEVASVEMLCGFIDLYEQADVVTGHYVRFHDLPIIQGAMMEADLGTLSPKLCSDTKVDLKTAKGVSKSQESLSDMLGVPAEKLHMTQAMWRSGNRLEPAGIAEVRKRVVGDIQQHKLLRLALLGAGMLKPPSIWKP